MARLDGAPGAGSNGAYMTCPKEGAPIFVDLIGASGARYRFRPWAELGPSASAGNFVVVEQDPAGPKVRLVGMSNDLSLASSHARAVGLREEALFLRLNVARATREQEHADLVAGYGPQHVIDG